MLIKAEQKKWKNGSMLVFLQTTMMQEVFLIRHKENGIPERNNKIQYQWQYQ